MQRGCRDRRRALPLLLASTLSLAPLGSSGATADGVEAPTLAEADRLWRERARGQVAGVPDAAPIDRAIAAYRALLARRPEDLEVRWKLLRAEQFRGDYVLRDAEAKLRLYEAARELADASRRLLLERHELVSVADDPEVVSEGLTGDVEAAALYYYSAVHWGRWGEATGRLQAARQGVATKLRDFATVVIRIDETFDDAAGYRLLGRLHTEAPHIPFVTGWVDRDRAVSALVRACEIAPDNPFNQVYLADALLRFRPDRRAEAKTRLEQVVGSPPRSDQLIEDLTAIAEARRLLDSVASG